MNRPGLLHPRAIRLGVTASGLSIAVLALGAGPAAAHVGITASTTAAGASAVLSVSVPHGCEGSPTTEITVRIPDQISAVTPTRNALWEVEKKVVTLDPPVADAHGNELTERVESVTYRTDEPLPEGYRDTFELSVQLPDAEGDTLVFPIVQTCEEGESAWIEYDPEGQDEDELGLPAPTIVLSAAEDDGHHDEDVTDASATAASEADAAATSVDASGTDALTFGALGIGALGAVLGATALVRQRRQA